MKKLLLPILFLIMALSSMSQVIVAVHGTITNTENGNPIPNHAVSIAIDSTAGWYYFNIVYTNNNGFYMDTVQVPSGSQGLLFIRTNDCHNDLHEQILNYNPGNLNFTSDFQICNTNSPCQAAFVAYPDSNALYSYQFIDQSLGNITNWNWNFGDGQFSILQNPSHAYSQPGMYMVCLNIQSADSTCFSYSCDTIVVGDPAPCHAAFTYFHFLTDPMTIHFTNASVGGNGVNLWNFGDGVTSTEENPIHTYQQIGQYSVGLSIGDSASGCFDYTYAMIQVGDSIAEPCHAAFNVYADSNALYSYHFIDQSTGNITNWSWNFGDGITSNLQNPSHVYAEPGIYAACLSIWGADSSCFDFTCDTIVVGDPAPCHAAFTYFHFLTDPMTIHFTNASVGGNGINLWNFGDGVTSTEENPIHTYQQIGQYSVGLSIGDSASGCFDYTYAMIQVGDSISEPCHAAFNVYADSNALYSYHFIDQSTGNITNWNWNFGDGQTSDLQNPSHVYAEPGIYAACLSIWGADSSCFDFTCNTIVVGDTAPCHAAFAYSIDPPPGNRTVVFTDLSPGNPTTWLWNFGDGTSDTVQNPVHTYAAAGTYNVCLQIEENNCTSTFCLDVVLYDSSYFHVIYGQVFAGNFPVSAGQAVIFSFDSTGNSQSFVGASPLDLNGVYYFTMVPDGNYYILAVPFDSMSYLPTYYGNVINWEQATVISLGAENNPYNINLVLSGEMTPGPGSASGQINMEGLKETIIDKVNMILMDAQGNAIGFTRVSTTGAFTFPTMAYGTYLLHPEMPGVTSDQVMITLTPENPHVEVVMTYNGNSILGLNTGLSIVDSWQVYPNPVVDQLNLSIDVNKSVKAEIGLYNFNGQPVSASSVVLQGGNNKIPVSTASFPVGLYTLRIYSSEGVNIVTKVVKTR